MVVSESLARGLWGDRSPVGQEMIYPMGTATVVGVAGDVQQGALQNRPPLTFYVPFAQHPRSSLSFVVRTQGPPADVLPAMREAVWRVTPDQAITGGGVLERIIGDSAREERYRTFLMGFFAALATLLAVVGIMGVTARHVSHRTRELGIRKVMGASFQTLLKTLITDYVIMILLATVVAVPLAYYASSKWIQAFEYRIVLAPKYFVLASLITLLLAVLTVSYLAVRSANTKPAEALRYE